MAVAGSSSCWGTRPFYSATPTSYSIGVWFEQLKPCRLLYHRRRRFTDYALSRTDLEALLLPLLQRCYEAQPRACPNALYMLQIVLLLLSQDASFGAAVQTIKLPAVPWYRERPLAGVSLGSLIYIVLLR